MNLFILPCLSGLRASHLLVLDERAEAAAWCDVVLLFSCSHLEREREERFSFFEYLFRAETAIMVGAARLAFGCFAVAALLAVVANGQNSARDRVRKLSNSARDGAISKEFSAIDADRDGSLSKKEFFAYMLKPASGRVGATADDEEHPIHAEGDSSLHLFDDREDVSDEFKAHFDEVHSRALNFWSALLNSIAMIIVTELGDKTFFIAAIMAMKHKRILVYGGAMGALALMTVLSAAIGFALPNILPKKYTHIASIGLFIFFGYKLLSEAYEMHVNPPKKNEELEEAEEEMREVSKDLESGGAANEKRRQALNILMKAFTLTFFAEWGDRSQVATIALASSKDPFGVTVGGTLGHALCTGLAVLGGRLLATKISEKQIAMAGGVLFIVFALHSAYAGP